MTPVREVDRFKARADDGFETTIIVTEDILDASHRGDPHATASGHKRARTITGLNCNRVQDGVFEIVQTKQIVRRV